MLTKQSIGKKVIMGVTGLFLVIFLIAHLSGNLLLFAGKEAFDAYAEFMSTNPLIRFSEIILLLGFLFHMLDAFVLTRGNQEARPEGYAYKKASSSNSSWFSRNMGLTGTVLLVFLILHLISFVIRHRFGFEVNFGADPSDFESDSMYKTVQTLFKIPWYSGIYVLAMVFLGFHLNHGFQSAFQSLGFNHTTYTPAIKMIGTIFSILVPLLFATMPLFFLFNLDAIVG